MDLDGTQWDRVAFMFVGLIVFGFASCCLGLFGDACGFETALKYSRIVLLGREWKGENGIERRLDERGGG